mgnify:FL=1|tara:strand:- start:32737 stop:33252 length:516 start_codon:yes stop_codon:yes gene_type:complete
MNKQDYYWLAIRIAGLYLIVDGVRWLPTAIAEGGLCNQLDVGVPIVAGALMLGIRVGGTTPAPKQDSAHKESGTVAQNEAAEQSEAVVKLHAGMTIDDWFWMACKVIGLWFAVQFVILLPMVVFMVLDTPSAWMRNIGQVVGLVVSFWLVLSDRLPRMVATTRRLSSKDAA